MLTIVFLTAAALTVQSVFLQSTDLLGDTAFLPTQQLTVAKNPAILRLENNLNADGTFSYTFDTENGIAAHAESTITKTADPDQSIQTIRGQYSYTGPDGVQYTVQYIADHNGYQAFGEHLPTPPPIPEAIQRALEYNAAHPEEDNGIIAASPALAPNSNAILTTLTQRPSTPLQPIVAAPLTSVEPLTTATPNRSPAFPTLPKQQQQQLAQTQLLAQTQVLQQQQLQPQQLQLQPQQLQPQQFQLQPQQLQPQDFLTQFVPSFQNFESQRRTSTNV